MSANSGDDKTQRAGTDPGWSEKTFRALVENSSDVVSLINIHGTVLYKSPSIKRILGFEPAELLGHNSFEMAHPDDRERLAGLFVRLLEEPDKTLTGEFRHLHKDGSYRWMEGVALNRLADPDLGAIVFNYRDITERKRAELELSKFRFFSEQANEAHFIISQDMRIQYANRLACETLGYSLEELLQLTVANIQPCFPTERAWTLFEQSKDSRLAPFEALHRRKDGSTFPVEITCTVLELEGELLMFSTARDITERKRAEQALRGSEHRLRLALESAAMGFYERDVATNQAVYDAQCCAVLGFPEGVSDPDLARQSVHPQDQPRVLAALARALDPVLRETCSDEFRIVRPDGQMRWVAASASVVFDDTARPPRPVTLMGVAQDITPRKLAEQELRQAKEQLALNNENLERIVEERTRALREIVAELEYMSYSMIHDMRAPLRAMSGFVHIVLERAAERLDEDEKDLLRRILASAGRMDQLIEGVLNYNNAVGERLPMAPTDPERLLHELLATYAEFIPFRAEIRVRGPFPEVLANGGALMQCFSRLLDNAIKFVQPGWRPRADVWAEKRGRMVRIWFQDNGIGIPKESQQKVFRMFQQLHLGYEGTGIGLALVQKLIERMNGRVGVESEEGQGSRFWVELEAVPGGQAQEIRPT